MRAHATSLFSPLLLVCPLAAQDVVFRILPSPDGQNVWNAFGERVALDRDAGLFAIADTQFGGDGDDHGGAFVYDLATGVLRFEAHLAAPTKLDLFGAGLAIAGGRVLVGAPGFDDFADQAGAVFVFSATDGTLLDTWGPSDAADFMLFGESIAVDDGVAVVGAPGLGNGAAYVFDVLTGQELRKLEASDGEHGDRFGEEVALEQGVAWIGATWADTTASFAGVVYAFDVATGTELFETAPADALSADHFGSSIDPLGDRVVVGMKRQGPQARAYVLDATTGAVLHTLEQDPNGEPAPWFGVAVGIDEDTAYVGSPYDDTQKVNNGMVHRFDLATGTELAPIPPPKKKEGGFFGWALAVDGPLFAVGSPRSPAAVPGAGLAHVLHLSSGIGETYCSPAVVNSSGLPAVLAAAGSDEAFDNDLVLRASQLPKKQFGYALLSMTQDFVAGPGGSQGNLCLGGQIGRFTRHVQKSTAGGEIALVLDLTDLPPPLQSLVLPGETWNFQMWFRDVNPDTTSNFTDAVSISFK